MMIPILATHSEEIQKMNGKQKGIVAGVFIICAAIYSIYESHCKAEMAKQKEESDWIFDSMLEQLQQQCADETRKRLTEEFEL